MLYYRISQNYDIDNNREHTVMQRALIETIKSLESLFGSSRGSSKGNDCRLKKQKHVCGSCAPQQVWKLAINHDRNMALALVLFILN